MISCFFPILVYNGGSVSFIRCFLCLSFLFLLYLDKSAKKLQFANPQRSSYTLNKNIIENMAKKLYVGGLPYRATEDELKDAFSVAGTVESAIIIIDRMSGRSKGFGFVEMATEEEAQNAIAKMNGAEMGGRTITVSEAREKKEGFQRDSGFGGNDQF